MPSIATGSSLGGWKPHSDRIRTSSSPRRRGAVYSQSLSPDGTILAIGGANGAVILWDAASLDPLSRFDGAHDGAVTALALSPDGRTLATGGTDRRVCLWDVASRGDLATLERRSGPVGRVRFLADGLTLATCVIADDGRNEVIVWPAAPGGSAAGEP